MVSADERSPFMGSAEPLPLQLPLQLPLHQPLPEPQAHRLGPEAKFAAMAQFLRRSQLAVIQPLPGSLAPPA